MADRKAKLTVDDKTLEFDILSPTLGADVININSLVKSGYFTYDAGFTSTAACESKITFIDGGKGVLLYRGYPIMQLASDSNFLEVCYLLLNGELPNKQQYEKFCQAVSDHSKVDDHIENIFSGFKKDAHPMAMLISALGGLSALYHDELNVTNKDDRMLSAIRLVSKIPTIAAMCYKHNMGEVFLTPKAELSYAGNFLHMMFSKSADDKKPDPVIERALDSIFTLHADHEQNASTSTVRLAGSTGANPYACIAAGVAALWGPAHGGANEAVLKMLHEIGSVDNIEKYIERAKDPNDSFRLMGFGHRVYKNYDPRAKVMREACHEVLEAVGKKDDPLFKLAMKLEEIALQDEYFIAKKLYPNVDFYSGITLSAIGIPTNMFTVIFALARTVGWISQWNEMLSGPYRLGRPRQLYTGAAERDYVAIDKR